MVCAMPTVAAIPWTYFLAPDSRVIAETASIKFKEFTEEIPLDDRVTAVRALVSGYVKSGRSWKEGVELAVGWEDICFKIPDYAASYRNIMERSYRVLNEQTDKVRPLSELAYEVTWYWAPSDLQERIGHRIEEFSERNFIVAAFQK